MALTSTETIQDIELLIKNIILEHNPTANIKEGYPLYDAFINPLARLIYEERQSIHIINNINKIKPLFSEEGTLLYPELTQFILDKFFISYDAISENFYTVNLYTTRKADIILQAGNYISLNNTTYLITPTIITKDSPKWKQEKNLYYHPIYLSSTEASIPTSSDWQLFINKYSVDPEETLFIKVTSEFYSNSFSTPEVTLQLLSDSISNRSMSNRRGIRYTLKTNSGFKPEELKKVEILGYQDIDFIEGYRELFKTYPSEKPVYIKEPNFVKLLLDYGYETKIIPCTFKFSAQGKNEYYSSNFDIYGDIKNQIRSLVIKNIFLNNYYDQNIYWKILLNGQTLTFSLATKIGGNYNEIATGSFTGEITDSIIIDIKNINNASEYVGQACIKFEENIPYNSSCFIKDINYSVYKIEYNKTDGLLIPLAIFCGNNSLELVTNYSVKYNSDSIHDIFTENIKIPIIAENTKLKILSDRNKNLIDNISLYNLKLTNTDDYTLYWTIEQEINIFRLKLYKKNWEERTSQNLVAISEPFTLADIISPNIINITSQNNSGIYGNFRFVKNQEITLEKLLTSDYNNKIVYDNNILGITQNNIFIQLNIWNGSINQYNDKTGYIFCIANKNLETVQAILNETKNNDLGFSIIADSFKPFIFSIAFNQEYILPFSNNSQTKEKYKLLFYELSKYFENYTGKISELDLTKITNLISKKTELYIKKIDYFMYTPRGHLIYGKLDLINKDKVKIKWDDILNEISKLYDPLYSDSYVLESTITTERLYKPVLIKEKI